MLPHRTIMYVRLLSLLFVCGFQLSSCKPSKTGTTPGVQSTITTLKICQEDELLCVENGVQACMSYHWICDGIKDCDDGSDETNCAGVIGPSLNDHHNLSRRALQPTKHLLRSETSSETPLTICQDNQFLCDETICIPQSWRCDYAKDCDDGSDETNCEIQFPTTNHNQRKVPEITQSITDEVSFSPNHHWGSTLPGPILEVSSSPKPYWRSDEAYFTYDEAIARCHRHNSEPFIPKSQKDWDMILAASLSLKKDELSKMWIPASDMDIEKHIFWIDGTDGNSDGLIPWMNGLPLHRNSPTRDCLVSDATHYGHVTMEKCNGNAYPMICKQKNSTTTFPTTKPVTSVTCDPDILKELILPDLGFHDFSYSQALHRCKNQEALPFIPRKQTDWDCIQHVNNDFSDRTGIDTYMWVPADDQVEENRLFWYDNSNANDDTLIPWIDDNTMGNNNDDNDCLKAYSFKESRVLMGNCDETNVYPMICIKDESTTSVKSPVTTTDGVTVKTTPLIETTVSDSTKSSVTFTTIDLTTESELSTTTKKPECESCSSNIPFLELYPNYTWPEGVPGSISSYNCPDGLGDKEATWICKKDCIWEELPDLSLCGTVDVDVWKDELMNGNISAGGTLDNLSSTLTSLDQIAPGDVISVLDILSVSLERHQKDLASLSTQEEQLTMSSHYTESTLQVTDAILVKPQVWRGLTKDQRYAQASHLQVVVEDAAVGTAILLHENSEKNFSTTTTDVHIEKFPKTKDRHNDIFTHPKFKSTYIKLPSLLNENSLSANIITFMAFSNLHHILGTWSHDLEDITFPNIVVASPVIGLTLGNSSWHSNDDGLNNFVQATFVQLYPTQEYNVSDLRCVSWSPELNNWDTSGCWLIEGDSLNTTTCHCNHLTNLAIIMDVNGVLDPNSNAYVIMEYVTEIGCSLSIICLAATIICLMIFADIRSKMISKIHINVCFCLMTAEIIMLAGLDKVDDTSGCIIIAAFLHYFFLSTFMWAAIEGFYLYIKIIKVFPTVEPKLRTYVLAGYTIPLLFVVITLASTLPVKNGPSYIGENACWLGPGIIWSFAAPLGLIMIINIVIFALCMKAQWRSNPSEVLQQKSNYLVKLRGSAMIFLVLGITWITGFFYIDNQNLAIPFVIMNSLQGVIIFLVLICSDRILRTRFKMMFSRWNGKEYQDPNKMNQGRRTTESELISSHQSSSMHDGYL